MSPQSPEPSATALQAGLFEFAIAELVRRHRSSFEPLWTVESWAKLMIWLTLNSGGSGDRQALEQFADALGPSLCGRMRQLFYQRELESLGLKLLADPAEAQVLVLPLAAAGGRRR
uniref:protein phosphatase n=1 Tax=Synechococcus sp. CS-1329 TaxID=2847975 RepID=UPI0028807CBD|nr:protein phosphatase [Synechococcus sp. CS-1329]